MEAKLRQLYPTPEYNAMKRNCWCPIKDVTAYYDITLKEVKKMYKKHPKLFVVEPAKPPFTHHSKIFAKKNLRKLLDLKGYKLYECWI